MPKEDSKKAYRGKATVAKGSYLEPLYENRERRFVLGLKPALKDAGIEPMLLGERFFQRIALQQNQSRGQFFELIAEFLLKRYLERLGYPNAELRKQVRFFCKDVLRIADFYAPVLKTLFEVKSGYIYWNKSTRQQAEKDSWLLENTPEVAEVVWFLFRGASANALKQLLATGINCVDLGFGDGSSRTSDNDPKTIIRV